MPGKIILKLIYLYLNSGSIIIEIYIKKILLLIYGENFKPDFV